MILNQQGKVEVVLVDQKINKEHNKRARKYQLRALRGILETIFANYHILIYKNTEKHFGAFTPHIEIANMSIVVQGVGYKVSIFNSGTFSSWGCTKYTHLLFTTDVEPTHIPSRWERWRHALGISEAQNRPFFINFAVKEPGIGALTPNQKLEKEAEAKKFRDELYML